MQTIFPFFLFFFCNFTNNFFKGYFKSLTYLFYRRSPAEQREFLHLRCAYDQVQLPEQFRVAALHVPAGPRPKLGPRSAQGRAVDRHRGRPGPDRGWKVGDQH